MPRSDLDQDIAWFDCRERTRSLFNHFNTAVLNVIQFKFIVLGQYWRYVGEDLSTLTFSMVMASIVEGKDIMIANKLGAYHHS